MRLAARLLFYPTLFYNLALCALRPSWQWWNWVDGTVLLGALSMGRHVPALKSLGVTGVVNTCAEYAGPLAQYEQAGIEQFRVPTTDFTPPTVESIKSSLAFIERHAARGGKVYVHCKAGRGRSATVAICYLIARGLSPDEAQAKLSRVRPQVMRSLAKRKVVLDFAAERTPAAGLPA